MRIGILTFHSAHNFGALLQCYALRTYLRSQYPCVDVINYAPAALMRRYELFPYYPYRKTLGELMGAVLAFSRNLRHFASYKQRSTSMRRFVREYLGVTGRKIKSADVLSTLPYDRFIMGSDQIWNPDIAFGMDRAFWGDFTLPVNSKCIAYAASMGKDRLDARYLDVFQRYLTNFSAISVRERSAVPFVREYAACSVCAVCDPVFLLSSTQWEELSQKAEVKAGEAYLLAHFTESNRHYREYAARMAAEKALPLICLNRSDGQASRQHQYVTRIGPLEFLHYIAQARYVVTNSFHAIALCILLHKPFTAFSHSSVGTRITDLLGTLDLTDPLTQAADLRWSDRDVTDWQKVDRAIAGQRMVSTRFLEQSIGA